MRAGRPRITIAYPFIKFPYIYMLLSMFGTWETLFLGGWWQGWPVIASISPIRCWCGGCEESAHQHFAGISPETFRIADLLDLISSLLRLSVLDPTWFPRKQAVPAIFCIGFWHQQLCGGPIHTLMAQVGPLKQCLITQFPTCSAGIIPKTWAWVLTVTARRVEQQIQEIGMLHSFHHSWYFWVYCPGS